MTEPIFSVVIAAHNAGSTIGLTIDSVLSQSEQDFELIVMDDGSEDRTLRVALEKADADPRIKVTSQCNQGVSAARNLGAALARGHYLAFLDADDVWHVDKLAMHRAAHEADPALEASYARIVFCTEEEGELKAGRTRSSVQEGPCQLEDVLIENVVCTMSNLVIERQSFLEIGGFKRTMRHAEDQDLLARFVGEGRRLCGIPETLVGYRMSADGLSCDFAAMLTAWKELVGRWSDRQDRPIVPLTVAAGFTVVGLAAMASADGLYPAMAGYALFGLSASVFMALHSSQTLRVLPRPRNRGRDLGIFNLANTVPSLIMPWLTLALVPSFGFSGLFTVLAALVLVAVALLASIQRQAARSD